MKLHRIGFWTAGLLALAVPLCAATPPAAETFIPQGLRDFTEHVNVVSVNTDELVKISKDLVNTYRVKSMTVTYKDPGMLQLAGKVGPLNVSYTMNGDMKGWRLGPIHGVNSIAGDPGKKIGLLDFGVLTRDQMDDFNTQFVREERTKDGTLYVYDQHFKDPKNHSHRLLWINPVRKMVTRREIFTQFGNQLKADYRYERPVRVAGGLWAPTIIKVYNGQGKLGAVSRASAIRINTGLSSAAFRV